MQRSILLILLILGLFFYLIPNHVQAAWEKYPNNPVLHSGNIGEWDDFVHTNKVLFLDGKFQMWYGGWDGTKGRIGYASSNDGISWDKYPTYVLDVENNEYQINDPITIYDNNKFKMWFRSAPSEDILYAESEDGINNWTRISITGLDKNQPWEIEAIAPGTVSLIDGTYYLWYTGRNNQGLWQIGVATSPDGIHWTQYENNPISSSYLDHANHPSVLKKDNKFYFWFHDGTSSNVVFAQSDSAFGPLEVNEDTKIAVSKGVNQSDFDNFMINFPTVIYHNGVYYMWYSGLNHLGVWSIGLATDGELQPELKLIILLPGLFGSWNSNAIIHGENPPQSEWTMTPFDNDYQGLIDTLIATGYTKDKNLFVFNYDWRDPIEETAGVLNDYIQNTVLPENPDKQISLIGHSLGGLVARTYAQNFGVDNIEQILTVGTPHSGTVQAYKAWEGGVIENENFWERLALDIIINLNRNGHLTDKDVIREIVPVTHDLLPTFDFLLNNQNQTIPLNSLTHQNTWLSSLENTFPNIFDKFYAIYGNKNQTPESYKVTNASFIENLLGLWQDGKPIETIFSNFGDETVLAKSATRSADPATLLPETNHRELVTNEGSIEEIMDNLGLTPQAIITPEPTPDIFPSLFMAIQSPAEFSISGPSGNFSSTDGYIFVSNIIGGNYSISVNGTESGIYTLYSGITTKSDSFWKTITNTTQNGQIDNYNFIVNTSTPDTSYIVDTNGIFYLDQAYEIIEKLKNDYPHWSLTLASHSIKTAQNNLNKNNYKKSAQSIPTAIKHIFSFIKKQSTAYPRNTAYDAVTDLSKAYEILKKLSGEKPNTAKIQGELLGAEGLKKAAEAKLNIKGNELEADSFLKAKKLLDEAKTDFQNGNYFATEIKIFVVKELFAEI